MSLRELVEPDCGGQNPLMRLGSHVIRDVAYKDEGLSHGAGPSFINRPQQFDDEQLLINDFQRQIAMPPQTFRMDSILQEMREIDAKNFAGQLKRAPPVIEEVNAGGAWANDFITDARHRNINAPPPPIITELHADNNWANQFMMNKHMHEPYLQGGPPPQIHRQQPQRNDYTAWTTDFFNTHELAQSNKSNNIQQAAKEIHQTATEDPEQFKYSEFMNFMKNVSEGDEKLAGAVPVSTSWADEFASKNPIQETANDWAQQFIDSRDAESKSTENYNSQFWNHLQDEWKKIAQDSEKHPWLSEFSDYYDPYKEYTFDEANPMADIDNAFEKGKAFLAQGDIPSAVLCFESAVKHDPENAEIWQLLGISQAENEKDPNAIAALKKSLDLNPGNLDVLMALAVSYTNESLQSQALKMLISWMSNNEKYRHLVSPKLQSQIEDGAVGGAYPFSGPGLEEIQGMFLRAVQEAQQTIDPDIQEALGVLFNLSSEYDKAVDCFQAALSVRPDNAKTWNRLGASLANGTRSVEAVDAYHRALEIQPGFVRARYNVGIICINLKAYKEAAEHFLTALNHQASSMQRSGLNDQNAAINQMSDTIWSTLRMVISLMGRIDLQPAIDNRDLNVLNKAFETTD